MRRPWTWWLALGLWLLMIALASASLVMKELGWQGAGNTTNSGLVALFVAFTAFATMGALVAARVPANPIGWVFLSIAIGAATSGVAENYAYHGLLHDPGSLPGALFVGWLYEWGWVATIGLIGFVPLLYPTGKVPGPRWRFVLWGEMAFVALIAIFFMFNPGPLDDGKPPLPDNPVGIGLVGPIVDRIDPVLAGGLVFFLLAAAVSVVVRFRRSRGDERQQMKVMAVASVLLALGVVGPDLLGIKNSGDVLFSVAVLQLPVAVGIAMLKYRLYDVDRLINKTLVYGGLTAILGAAYFGLVLAGQAVSSSLAGGGSLAIAVSTLVVAALFLPLRSRVQAFVDRRFYRRRYDAQRTLEGFGARLRQQVELDGLQGDLVAVVGETMQPSHVRLWLRTEVGR